MASGSSPDFILKVYIGFYTSMEININFSVPSSASAAEICTILSRVMVDIALNDAEGFFGPADYTVNQNGECIATYSVLAEPDAEDCYPYNCHDMSDDADALASAGYGSDEDYGGYSGDY